MSHGSQYNNDDIRTQQLLQRQHSQYMEPGASKGTPGDAKCVTEIFGGQK